MNILIVIVILIIIVLNIPETRPTVMRAIEWVICKSIDKFWKQI